MSGLSELTDHDKTDDLSLADDGGRGPGHTARALVGDQLLALFRFLSLSVIKGVTSGLVSKRFTQQSAVLTIWLFSSHMQLAPVRRKEGCPYTQQGGEMVKYASHVFLEHEFEVLWHKTTI
jgi:hypothetical protein